MHTLTISIGVHRMYSHWTLPTDVSIDIGKCVFLYLPPHKLIKMENQQGWANTYHSSSPCFNRSPHSAYWPQLCNKWSEWLTSPCLATPTPVSLQCCMLPIDPTIIDDFTRDYTLYHPFEKLDPCIQLQESGTCHPGWRLTVTVLSPSMMVLYIAIKNLY